jgi:death on curing protein
MSAIDRPRNGSSVFGLAAVLCGGIAQNDPFIDGNKRTAFLATRAFLFVNGYALEPVQDDEVVTLIAVADGSLAESALADWNKKLPRGLRPVTPHCGFGRETSVLD